MADRPEHRIPIDIDLEPSPPQPDGPAYVDPTTVHGIKCAASPETIAQLQQVMRAQGSDDVAPALAQLVAMGSFMFNELSQPGTEAWIYRGDRRQEIRLGP